MKMYKTYECGGQLSRDFTLEKYSNLIKVLKKNYKTMRVVDYLTMPETKKDLLSLTRTETCLKFF